MITRVELFQRILRAILISLVIVCLLLIGCQERLIYYPRTYEEGDYAVLRKAGGRRLDYQTSQGAQTAFYIPPKGGDAGVLPQRIWLCFAGNGSLALDWLFVEDEWDRASGYLLIDYPKYGACEGRPNPNTIRESSLAAVRRMTDELGASLEDLRPRLAVIGHSIGAAAALMMADDLDVKRAILVSPFTTMTEMGRRVVGWPLCLLNRNRFDNRSHLASIVSKGARVTIFHGAADEIVPTAMGRELAAIKPEVIELIEVPDAGHNDVVLIAGTEIAAAMTQEPPASPHGLPR